MAKFCSNECEESGSICDFCKHYIDNSKIKNLKQFVGDGICNKKNIETDCLDGCECEEFECFRLN